MSVLKETVDASLHPGQPLGGWSGQRVGLQMQRGKGTASPQLSSILGSIAFEANIEEPGLSEAPTASSAIKMWK